MRKEAHRRVIASNSRQYRPQRYDIIIIIILRESLNPVTDTSSSNLIESLCHCCRSKY